MFLARQLALRTGPLQGSGDAAHDRLPAFRIGDLINPNLMLYGKGGAAWTKVNHVDFDTTPVMSLRGRAEATRSGWISGDGVEYSLPPKWAVFAEYDFADFGSKDTTLVDNEIHFTGWRNVYVSRAQNVTLVVQYKFQ
jgi:opacity protein-like surface antigen